MASSIKNNTTKMKKEKVSKTKARKNTLDKELTAEVTNLRPLPQEQKRANEYLELLAEIERRELELQKLEAEKDIIMGTVLKRNPKLKQIMASVSKMESALSKSEMKADSFIEKLLHLMKTKCYQGLRFRIIQEFKRAGCAYTKVFEALIEENLIDEQTLYEVIARFSTRKKRTTLTFDDELLKIEKE